MTGHVSLLRPEYGVSFFFIETLVRQAIPTLPGPLRGWLRFTAKIHFMVGRFVTRAILWSVVFHC